MNRKYELVFECDSAGRGTVEKVVRQYLDELVSVDVVVEDISSAGMSESVIVTVVERDRNSRTATILYNRFEDVDVFRHVRRKKSV
jgi:hypothetical protein